MYKGGNTTVVIARISSILWVGYDMIWSTLEFPSFNFNSIFDGFHMMKWMSNMMPLSRHTLSLQTRLHRQFILGTVIPPTLDITALCPHHCRSGGTGAHVWVTVTSILHPLWRPLFPRVVWVGGGVGVDAGACCVDSGYGTGAWLISHHTFLASRPLWVF